MPPKTEHLEHAISLEEQGDRWIISDLSKTLRFYQQAYDAYQIAATSVGEVDAWYNYLRLLYHVHVTYKDVPPVVLTSVEGCIVHHMSLMDVKREYERVINGMFNGWLNWECGFNEALICLEMLEDEIVPRDKLLSVVEESVVLVKKVLDYQLSELDSFIKRMENNDENESSYEPTQQEEEEETETDEQEEYQMFEQVTPESVMETITTGYKIVQAAFEYCDDREQINVLLQGLTSFIQDTLKPSADLIISKFDPESHPNDSLQLNIDKDDIVQLRLTEWCIQALLISDFTQFSTHWSQCPVPISTDRHLAEADSLENFMSLGKHNSEEIWSIIARINQCLKSAQELLKIELDEQRANKTAEVSPKVSKIVQVLINRADDELIRSELKDYEPSVKNSQVLRQNSINLLKSGLNTSQSNVGLRETVGDKLKREKLRRECIVRLVLLTKESVNKEDFIRNLGESYWRKEVEDLGTLDVYRYALSQVQDS
ncbi:hypothetical protein BON22_1352 [Cyberlindnera fabianii]|uniref:Uncharacterized protein n=1 Tax=Cyberlindnera fabianii TaxID=36022 RepID=A0A1V2LAI3_CYBFA|nr:hypothetical protein BON22_1352 [Cyberlindnera fabianii]